jgi:hypothetical protein
MEIAMFASVVPALPGHVAVRMSPGWNETEPLHVAVQP